MTYPSLSDQHVQSTNASTITRRHAINFVHDEAGSISDPDAACGGFLFKHAD